MSLLLLKKPRINALTKTVIIHHWSQKKRKNFANWLLEKIALFVNFSQKINTIFVNQSWKIITCFVSWSEKNEEFHQSYQKTFIKHQLKKKMWFSSIVHRKKLQISSIKCSKNQIPSVAYRRIKIRNFVNQLPKQLWISWICCRKKFINFVSLS